MNSAVIRRQNASCSSRLRTSFVFALNATFGFPRGRLGYFDEIFAGVDELSRALGTSWIQHGFRACKT